jgi:hypothetical protein
MPFECLPFAFGFRRRHAGHERAAPAQHQIRLAVPIASAQVLRTSPPRDLCRPSFRRSCGAVITCACWDVVDKEMENERYIGSRTST